MGAVVDAAESFGVDMAVDLGRGERRVAEELLDRPKVGAAFDEVRGEGVTKAVRVGHQPTEGGRVETSAGRREEEDVCRATCQLRPRLLEIDADAVRRLLAQRDDAFLAPFPA